MKTIILLLFSVPCFCQSHFIQMPPVQSQGSEGSCVPVGLLYSVDATYYYATGASSYSTSTNIFSPEFLYNQVKASSSCSSGSSLLNCLNFLTLNGVCLWQTMPYSDTNGCALQPDPAQSLEASKYKIASYSMILGTDSTQIKSQLDNNHSLVFTYTEDSNFFYYKPGQIINSYSNTFYGPHCATICGYDDSKRAYKVINTYGPAWGDQGYFWIDYDFFKTITYSVYSISLEQTAKTPLLANAGPDLSYNVTGTNLASITISGSASGGIGPYKYLWKDLTTNDLYPVQNVLVQKPAGKFLFALTVTDANNQTASDTMQVNVTQTYTTSISITYLKSKSISWKITTDDKFISATIFKNGISIGTVNTLTGSFPAQSGTYYMVANCQNSSSISSVLTSGKKIIGAVSGLLMIKNSK